ncbi:MAG: TonB-dependent receptor domain-containing protein [Flavobacteriales bacterium]
MRKLICLLLLAHTAGATPAQVLRGVVTDAETKKPLVYATVAWLGTATGTFTDEGGVYNLPLVQETDLLVVAFTGYRTDTIDYMQRQILDVALQPDATGPAVVVMGDKPSTNLTMLNPQLFQVMNEKELCKAACCNLSESFETNASIDAAFADAITGTRQIRMLGLDGKYTQMMFDNMPAVRGLASTYGLTYVPGSWVKNIYIAKGVGSVTSGYESITGQINVAFKNPDTAERVELNAYAGTGGRLELNMIWRPQQKAHEPEGHGEKHRLHFHPVFLAHGAMSQLRTDMNRDGFLDNPLFNNIILRNEWHMDTDGGLGGQYAASYLHINNVSGKLDYDPLDEVRSQLWGVNMTTDRYELTAKTGYVFPEKEWQSIGSQVSGSLHQQQGNFGFRQYSGSQWSARANLLFASRIRNDNHKYTAGVSYTFDDYRERIYFGQFPPVPMASLLLNRTEQVPGAFAEYTWNYRERLLTVAGMRADYHNIYGLLLTPRLHTRYSLTEHATLKALAGKGYRTPNLLMDNVGILAGNRNIYIEGNDPAGIFGLKMEEAWNFGVLFNTKFKLAHRDASLSIDAYHTRFVNQVVVDMETAAEVHFYNLDGPSYSNSAQAEAQWSPMRRLEWRLAYRWLDVKTQYGNQLLLKPLVNRHRAFTNVAYATKEGSRGQHWRMDATLQWISSKRLPHAGTHAEHSAGKDYIYTEPYVQLNAQVTYAVKKDFEFYIGGENLTNFMIHDAILLADNPASEYFDGALVWGPVFGRMGYIGMRWKL